MVNKSRGGVKKCETGGEQPLRMSDPQENGRMSLLAGRGLLHLRASREDDNWLLSLL